MGRGEDLRPSLGFLWGRRGGSTGRPFSKGAHTVSLGASKGHPRTPRETRRSREAPRGRLKPLRAPCREVPRCPPTPPATSESGSDEVLPADNPNPTSRDVVSVRLEGALADEVNRIAEEDGLSRSEILRRLLVASLESEQPPTVRCLSQLGVIERQLEQITATLDDVEAEAAAESVEAAAGWVTQSIEELEEFEEEDD